MPRLAGILRLSGLPSDVFISLEEKVPYYSKRIDAVLFGYDSKDIANIILIELKAWTGVDITDEGNVLVKMRGAAVEMAHPSAQAYGYQEHLQDFCRAFSSDQPIQLSSCAYCHDYVPGLASSGLLAPQFNHCRVLSPLFTANQANQVIAFVQEKLARGKGEAVVQRYDQGGVGFSKNLVDYAGEMINRQNVFTLLDEQIPVNNTILSAIKKALKTKKRQVIVVKGGPGTGKSVIALNALGEIIRRDLSVYLVSGSAAFTHSMRRLLGKRLDGLVRFTDFFWDKPDSADVLIIDEAHRIRDKSQPRVLRESRPKISQIEELIGAAKVTIFFVDENQIISPKEVGEASFFKDSAKKLNTSYKEFQLANQFRCNGSKIYLDWLDDVLGLTPVVQGLELLVPNGFDFKILDSPHELLNEVEARNYEAPNSARLLAGWCWPWSDPKADGTLVNDIQIGDFEFPWEAKNGSKPASGIPEAKWWAIEPSGVSQAGTVYSVQGFESKHVSVVFGPDLVIRNGVWLAQPRQNFSNDLRRKSAEIALPYIKRIYRTLLSRGIYSCSIYCIDDETRHYIESKIIHGCS